MTDKNIIKKIQRIYDQTDGLNSTIFYRDYSSGYRYALGCHSEDKDMISITPDKSNLERLLRKKHYHDLSYDIETAIECAVYSLMHYGIAYIYINAEYIEIEKETGHKESVLESLQIGEVRGIITKKTETNIEFWGLGPIGSIQKRNYNPNGLVKMDLKDLGYSKTHFSRIARKLDKYDITSSSLIYNNSEGYDFSEHLKKSTLQEYKITRDLGWLTHPEGLSESQYYYRRIKQKKLKISMMRYVIDSINKRLQSFISDFDGKITVNLQNSDYDKLWGKYIAGEISASELSAFI